MGKWLSEQWIQDTLRLAKAMPERPGLTATLNYLITDGPNGDVEYFWEVKDGHLASAGMGSNESAEVTLTITYQDARQMQMGEIDANTAFMQGKIQVSGDMMKLLELLPVTSSQEYRDLEAALAEVTEF